MPRPERMATGGTAPPAGRLDIGAGKVAGPTVERYRPKEFLAFFNYIAEGIEPGTEVHSVLNNAFTFKLAEIREWLKSRLDRKFRFKPASATWTNAVEVFFSRPSRKRPKNAMFNSLDENVGAIQSFMEN